MVSSVYTRVPCSTTGCTKPAIYFCRFPVKRRGRTEQCRRPMCQRCSSSDRHCPPHARIAPEALIKICAACLTASCPAGLMVCTKPEATRLVTKGQYLSILSFGIL